VKADTLTSWMMFYWVMPCPAQSLEYNEVLAAVGVMWNESQFCLTGAQLSVLPGSIQDHIYEQCPGESLAALGWRWTPVSFKDGTKQVNLSLRAIGPAKTCSLQCWN
jgi:hypothetical protein